MPLVLVPVVGPLAIRTPLFIKALNPVPDEDSVVLYSIVSGGFLFVVFHQFGKVGCHLLFLALERHNPGLSKLQLELDHE
mgnify:CR=1 FL=1